MADPETAVDRVSAALALAQERGEDRKAALQAARAREFSGIARRRDITHGRYGISIRQAKAAGGEVEVYARVFRDGEQIGFGVDGSVDVERFVIVNPPVLVKDDTGDVVITSRGLKRQTRYRIDPLEAVRDALADMIVRTGKPNGIIVPGKEGRTTYTIFSNGADDGQIASDSETYTTARAGSNLSATAADTTLTVGQLDIAGTAICYEGFVNFTTSPVVGTVSSAALSLYGEFDGSTTNFTVNARRLDYTAGGLTTADWKAGADLSALPLLASFVIGGGGWSTAGYNALTSEAAFLTNINTSGTTGIILSSSRHEGNNAPGASTSERVTAYAGNQSGTTNDPRLVVEATAGPNIAVVMHHLRQQGIC